MIYYLKYKDKIYSITLKKKLDPQIWIYGPPKVIYIKHGKLVKKTKKGIFVAIK